MQPPNDLRVSGERERVRCTRVLGSQPLDALDRRLVTMPWRHALSPATGPNAVARPEPRLPPSSAICSALFQDTEIISPVLRNFCDGTRAKPN